MSVFRRKPSACHRCCLCASAAWFLGDIHQPELTRIQPPPRPARLLLCGSADCPVNHGHVRSRGGLLVCQVCRHCHTPRCLCPVHGLQAVSGESCVLRWSHHHCSAPAELRCCRQWRSAAARTARFLTSHPAANRRAASRPFMRAASLPWGLHRRTCQSARQPALDSVQPAACVR